MGRKTLSYGSSFRWMYLPNTGHNKHLKKRSVITVTEGKTISEIHTKVIHDPPQNDEQK